MWPPTPSVRTLPPKQICTSSYSLCNWSPGSKVHLRVWRYTGCRSNYRVDESYLQLCPPPPWQVENPLLNQEPVYRPYIQYTLYVYAAVYQARISTPPFTLHTSLFTTLPVFTQIAVMCKSLCNSWCYFLCGAQARWVRGHLLRRHPTPNHNLNKVCIQDILFWFGTT